MEKTVPKKRNPRQQICDGLCEERDRALKLCAEQGWPESPVDSEFWAATAAIVHACQLWHNVAVVRSKTRPTKTYIHIGSAIIKARPQINTKTLEHGYEITYGDGYRRWLPEDVFEGNYRETTSQEMEQT